MPAGHMWTMSHTKVVFSGDSSRTAAAEFLTTKRVPPLFRSPRNPSREPSVAEVKSWAVRGGKVSIWDMNSDEQFAPARHLLLVPSESVFVIWLDTHDEREGMITSAVRSVVGDSQEAAMDCQ